jgi:hypothetical protein
MAKSFSGTGENGEMPMPEGYYLAWHMGLPNPRYLLVPAELDDDVRPKGDTKWHSRQNT